MLTDMLVELGEALFGQLTSDEARVRRLERRAFRVHRRRVKARGGTKRRRRLDELYTALTVEAARLRALPRCTSR